MPVAQLSRWVLLLHSPNEYVVPKNPKALPSFEEFLEHGWDGHLLAIQASFGHGPGSDEGATIRRLRKIQLLLSKLTIQRMEGLACSG